MVIKHWKIPAARSLQLSGSTVNSTSHVISALLVARGYVTPEEQQLFLNPMLSHMCNPLLLKGMNEAVERLLRARDAGEAVCVYGDYDVDGITSTAILVSFLRRIGCHATYFIPNRFDDGYGLNRDSLLTCIESGAKLIISVDCGITSIDEAIFCQQHGTDLIIVDHHAPGEIIPVCCAVLNPLQPGCEYPFKALAGVGVTFNLIVALRAALRQKNEFIHKPEPDLREWFDLLALGTIADVVPLTGQNRIYVKHGLSQLSRSSRPGIVALKMVAGVKEPVSCGQVGFRLAPRLNAGGRMESAVPGVDLLLSDNLAQSLHIAEELDAANAERQQVERTIFEQAVAMVEESGCYPACRSIVLASDTWHQGVIGIVASRLVDRYHRPTILIAISDDGTGKGSGRSIPGFHLLEALKSCSRYLERCGGHRYAAGVGLASDKFEVFKQAFEEESKKMLTDEDCIPCLKIDTEVSPDQVTVDLAEALTMMEPYGAGNPEPILIMRGMQVVDRRIMAEKHLRFALMKDGVKFSAIGFGMAGNDASGLIDIAFFPELNIWNGTSRLQLRLKDFRLSE